MVHKYKYYVAIFFMAFEGCLFPGKTRETWSSQGILFSEEFQGGESNPLNYELFLRVFLKYIINIYLALYMLTLLLKY